VANNFESIFGGIFRGLASNKSSAGLNQTNTQSDKNPLTYAWIGQQTNDLRQPIEKEQSQSPALPGLFGSSGTAYSYSVPLPTDVRSIASYNNPATSVALNSLPSQLGSTVHPAPAYAPIDNWAFRGYGMSPQNGDHFKQYFANQMGNFNMMPKPNPSNVLTAVSDQANIAVDGSADVWQGTYQTMTLMGKRYNPMANYRGA